MSMQIQPYVTNEVRFDRKWLEFILLEIADAFDIQVVWDSDCAVLAGILAFAGALVGGYAGGRMGAALGGGIGGAAGLGIAKTVPLREIWMTVKEKLKELFYIVFNFLRRLDAIDYLNAFEMLMACAESKQALVKIIMNFITQKLGREVLSSLTAA